MKKSVKKYLARLIIVCMLFMDVFPAAAEDRDMSFYELWEEDAEESVFETGEFTEEADVLYGSGQPDMTGADGDASGDGSLPYVPGEIIVCVKGGLDDLLTDIEENRSVKNYCQEPQAAEGPGASLRAVPGEEAAENDGSFNAGGLTIRSVFKCDLTAEEAQDYSSENGSNLPGVLQSAGLSGNANGFSSAEPELSNGENTDDTEEAEAEILLISTDRDTDIREMAEEFEALRHVEFAQPNYIHPLAETDPSDNYVLIEDSYRKQWAYSGSSVYGLGDGQNENKAIWEEPSTSVNINPEVDPSGETPMDAIVVALLDSGVDYNNPLIKDSMWHCPQELMDNLQQKYGLISGEYGFASAEYAEGNDDTGEVMDTVGHGTHCAGIISASWKNNEEENRYLYGAANNAKIMAVRAGNKDGGLTDSALLAGFYYIKCAVEEGVNVVAVNNSWGGFYENYAIERAVTELGKLGTLSIFASGNDGMDIDIYSDTSSCFTSPYSVTVNAHDENGEPTGFTNYGMRTTDISAPGLSILSAASFLNMAIDCGNPARYTPAENADGEELYTCFDNYINTPSDYVEAGGFRFTMTEGRKIGVAENRGTGERKLAIRAATGSDYTAGTLAEFGDAEFDTAMGANMAFTVEMTNWEPGCYYEVRRSEYSGGSFRNEMVYTGRPSADGILTVTIKLPQNPDFTGYHLKFRLLSPDRKRLYDPGSVLIGDVLISQKGSAYAYMSGTSMAAPAVSGEAAVIAAKFAPAPVEDENGVIRRAEEIRARIIGSAGQFADDYYAETNRSGGIASLYNAVNGIYNPVPVSASYADGKITVEGYFFGSEASELYFNGTEIPAGSVTWNITGTRDQAVFPAEETIEGEYEIIIQNGSRTGRNLIYLNTPVSPGDRMERLSLEGTDDVFFDGRLLSLCSLNDKLYALTGHADMTVKGGWAQIWEYDPLSGGGWKDVSGKITGDPEAEVYSWSKLVSYDGKLVYFMEYENSSEGIYRTYLVSVDPMDGYRKTVALLEEEGERNEPLEELGCVCGGDKLIFTAYDPDRGRSIIMLFRTDDSGTVSRYGSYPAEGVLEGSFMYGEDGDLFFYGTAYDRKRPSGEFGLYQFTAADTEASWELLRAGKLYPEKRVTGGQMVDYSTAVIKDGILSTGMLDRSGKDTYLLDGTDGDFTALDYYAGESKLFNTYAAAYKGYFYVLADTRSGAEYGRIFARLDLSKIGRETIPNPGDREIIAIPSAVTGLIYNGTEQTGVPDGTGYTLENAAATNAGIYTAAASPAAGFRWEDGTTATKQIPWSIGKADYGTGGISFSDGSYEYDRNGHALTVSGSLTDVFGNEVPAEVTYEGNGQKKTGSYTVTAYILKSGDANYNDLYRELTAELTILKRYRTVTLNSNGGTGAESIIAAYDEELPAAAVPKKPGYTFEGYYDAVSGGTKYYNADGTGARIWDKPEAAALYALWKKNSGRSDGGGGGSSSCVPTFSENWYMDALGVWRIRDSKGESVANAWLCDNAIPANGENVWYLLQEDGSMITAGLVQDNTGNFYSLETEHNGYFGMLRYKDGYYNCNGQQIYLTFNREHKGSFGAVTNADGIEKLKAVYGLKQIGIGNESSVYTASF